MEQGILAAATAGGGIFGMAKEWMNKIYADIVTVTLVAGGVCAAVCLFLMLFSKNQKTVDGSVSWLKRIVIAMVGILAMSTIINYLPDRLELKDNDGRTLR